MAQLADSDLVNLGSNPSSPANDFNELHVTSQAPLGAGYHPGITGIELRNDLRAKPLVPTSAHRLLSVSQQRAHLIRPSRSSVNQTNLQNRNACIRGAR